MFVLDQDILLKVLQNHEGVPLASYGKPRDGFELTQPVANWTSGFGGKYEMVHKNVPAGVMIAVGKLNEIDLDDFEKLKSQLKDIDIYPTGKSGDFTGVDVDVLKKWFFDRSRLDNEVNSQVPISHVKNLTPKGLGADKYNELVDYLADNMTILKDPEKGGALTPADKTQRAQIVIDILDGLSKSIRYTRLDAPAMAYQLKADGCISREGSADIFFNLTDEHKILVVRQHENKQFEITPLDKSMIGHSYATVDGEPLAERGMIDIGEVVRMAVEIEEQKLRDSLTPDIEKRPPFLDKILRVDVTTVGVAPTRP